MANLRHRQQLDQVAKFRSGRQKEINRWPTHGHRQQLDQVAHFVRTKSGDAMRNLGGNPRDYVIFNVERAFSAIVGHFGL